MNTTDPKNRRLQSAVAFALNYPQEYEISSYDEDKDIFVVHVIADDGIGFYTVH